MLYAVAETARTPIDLVRLYIHEASRVYRDKLVDNDDMEGFDNLIQDTVKKNFEVTVLSVFALLSSKMWSYVELTHTTSKYDCVINIFNS